ncbi:hypothetical protein WJX81_006591 [Elliptochloris bilobata]|uniref:Aminotransferase class I/classII large domain-containing protein n=1 Tax=Elliptochloris bilobata TaxID=381761 RepID=A0AAW1RFE8_9CHLO
MAPLKPVNSYLDSIKTTIFSVMSALAVEHSAVNLGQGFPDDEGPDAMKEKAAAALYDHNNQYPPYAGVAELKQAVARHSERYSGIPVDAATETLVTVGASEALTCAFLGLVNRGDEVILFDPQYDLYAPAATFAGAVIRTVQLDPNDWSVPHAAMEAAFSERTKLVLINSPHNPTGKVFSDEDLAFIAGLCVKHNTYAVCDEVYEHLVFEGSHHRSLRTFPGMADRAVRVGSAGKTFSFTAWKIGWVTGPARLVTAVAKAHQFVTFTVASSLQRAVAYGLDHEVAFYTGLGKMLEGKRAYLERRLKEIGFQVLPAQGTYFLIADFSTETDTDFSIRLTKEAGVTTIPVSAFYISADPPRTLVRFCFCKTDDKLRQACDALESFFGKRRALQPRRS